MKRAVALALVVTTCIMSGCGSDQVREVRQPVTFPTEGSVATRGVGEQLLERATGILVPSIQLQEDAVIGKYRLAKGQYEFDEEDADAVWYDGEDEDFYMRKSDGQLCIEDAETCAPAKYTFGKMLSDVSEDSLQQTLLYNGKIGDRITLGYREFYNNLARPAFSNNVEYDLSESKIVGYKGARLEIIKATNTELTYKVLSGFTKSGIR